MGYGDDIMATAAARCLFDSTGLKAVFGRRDGPFHWSEVFENNPAILQPDEQHKALVIENYPGHRPYVLAISNRHIVFNKAHRAVRGDLHFSDEEESWLRGLGLPRSYKIVEPHVKGKVSAGNKDWGWSSWQRYVERKPGGNSWFQVGPAGTKTLEGVELIETPTFRKACLVLRGAYWFAGTDGGLHHAAAAMRVPGSIVWGGFSHPDILGYGPLHFNYGGGFCGALDDCQHCRNAMKRVSPGWIA